MAKLVDARDLKSLVLYGRAGSSPAGRTTKKVTLNGWLFCWAHDFPLNTLILELVPDQTLARGMHYNNAGRTRR